MNAKNKVFVTIMLMLAFTWLALASLSFASVPAGVTVQGEGEVSFEGDITTAPYHTIIPCQATDGVGSLWYKGDGLTGKFHAIVLHVYFIWLSRVGAVDTCY